MSKIPASTIWPLVQKERLALIADLEKLTPDQWQRESLAAGWSVHDVAAHLVDNALATTWGLILAMARAGFNFDRQNDQGVARNQGATTDETLGKLREVASRRTGPPAPVASRLVEEIAHGEDLRRVLGLHRNYPNQSVELAIGYQANTPQSVGGAKELAGKVQLCSDDEKFTLGIGPRIVGSRLELLMLVSGRGKHARGLTGPGMTYMSA